MKPAPCPEKRDLIGAYQLATRKYSEAVASLNQNMGICGRDRYDAFPQLSRRGAGSSRTRRSNAWTSTSPNTPVRHSSPNAKERISHHISVERLIRFADQHVLSIRCLTVMPFPHSIFRTAAP